MSSPEETATVSVPWLGGRLRAMTHESYGAHEHRQIAGMLDRADAYILTADLVRDIVQTIEQHTSSIEMNVDLISVGATPIWIEFPDHARRRPDRPALPGVAEPVLVGALIARDEDNHDRFAIVTAWDFPDGTVRHSYGVAAFSLIDLAHLAYGARRLYSRTPEDALSRILHHATIYIPPGLHEELKIVQEIDGKEDEHDDALDLAALDVTAEIPFVLTALLAISTGQAALSRQGDSGPWLAEPNAERVGWLSGRLKGKGFVRKGKPTAPSAIWRLAA